MAIIDEFIDEFYLRFDENIIEFQSQKFYYLQFTMKLKLFQGIIGSNLIVLSKNGKKFS